MIGSELVAIDVSGDGDHGDDHDDDVHNYDEGDSCPNRSDRVTQKDILLHRLKRTEPIRALSMT